MGGVSLRKGSPKENPADREMEKLVRLDQEEEEEDTDSASEEPGDEKTRVRAILQQIEENTVLRQAVQFGPRGLYYRSLVVYFYTLSVVFIATLVFLAFWLQIPWLPNAFGTSFGVVLLLMPPLQLIVVVVLLYFRDPFVTLLAVGFTVLTLLSVIYADVCAVFTILRTIGLSLDKIFQAATIAVCSVVVTVLQIFIVINTDLAFRTDERRRQKQGRSGCCYAFVRPYREALKR